MRVGKQSVEHHSFPDMVEVFVLKTHMIKMMKKQIRSMRALTSEWMKNERREGKRDCKKSWKGFVKNDQKSNNSFQI